MEREYSEDNPNGDAEIINEEDFDKALLVTIDNGANIRINARVITAFDGIIFDFRSDDSPIKLGPGQWCLITIDNIDVRLFITDSPLDDYDWRMWMLPIPKNLV
jgi:hypothetical protein